MCSCRGLAVSWLKTGVSSKQFWNSDTRAKMYRPNLALDMATTRRLTSLWKDWREKKGKKVKRDTSGRRGKLWNCKRRKTKNGITAKGAKRQRSVGGGRFSEGWAGLGEWDKFRSSQRNKRKEGKGHGSAEQTKRRGSGRVEESVDLG